MRRRKLKVLKAKGGADASKADFGVSNPSPGDTGGAGGFGKDTQQFGNVGSSPTSTGNSVNNTTLKNTVKNVTSNVGNTTGQLSILPVTPFGMAVTGMTAIENQRRAKRAKGEYFLTNKKILPINRDFYRTEGRPLDTKIGSKDTQYMKDAGIIGFKKPKNLKDSGPNIQLCPDGTYPPCKTPATQINSVSKPNTFLQDFKAYDDGGEVIISSNVDKDLLWKID